MQKYSPAVAALSAFLKANALMPPVTGWPNSEAPAERRRATA
jgi:hypothetical protein